MTDCKHRALVRDLDRLCAELIANLQQQLAGAEREAKDYTALRAICARLIVAYDHEESEDGFPFSFELRDAHRALCRHMTKEPS